MTEDGRRTAGRGGDDGITVMACYGDGEATRRCALVCMYTEDVEYRRNQLVTHRGGGNQQNWLQRLELGEKCEPRDSL